MKITKATVKKFIKESGDSLFINVQSSFNGMIDGCESHSEGFVKAKPTDSNTNYTLGVSGAWFVGSSRDYFTPYEANDFKGIRVSNSCGSFILAVKK
jgi:hypothetical protein